MKVKTVSKRRILVVEDDQDIAFLVSTALEQSGYEVIQASDGLEGFYKARRENPNLMILDLNLPRLSGEEVCKAIREDLEDEAFARIPIIMLTAKAQEVDRIVGKVIGANYYLTKPFEIEEVLEKVRSLLNAL